MLYEPITIFIVSGILGWIVLSIFSGELTGYLWENYHIPFKPMFAIGALIIYFIHDYLDEYNIITQFIAYAIILTILEYIMFEVAEKMFNAQFRCYYNGKRLAILYAIYWGLLGTIFASILHEKRLTKENGILIIILIALGYIFRDGRSGYIILDDHKNTVKMC